MKIGKLIILNMCKGQSTQNTKKEKIEIHFLYELKLYCRSCIIGKMSAASVISVYQDWRSTAFQGSPDSSWFVSRQKVIDGSSEYQRQMPAYEFKFKWDEYKMPTLIYNSYGTRIGAVNENIELTNDGTLQKFLTMKGFH